MAARSVKVTMCTKLGCWSSGGIFFFGRLGIAMRKKASVHASVAVAIAVQARVSAVLILVVS